MCSDRRPGCVVVETTSLLDYWIDELTSQRQRKEGRTNERDWLNTVQIAVYCGLGIIVIIVASEIRVGKVLVVSLEIDWNDNVEETDTNFGVAAVTQ